jgi:hypothetical protein
MTCEFIPSLANAEVCKTCGHARSAHRRRCGRPRKLTPEQEASLVAWYGQRSVKKKAFELGISQTTMRNIILRHQA